MAALVKKFEKRFSSHMDATVLYTKPTYCCETLGIWNSDARNKGTVNWMDVNLDKVRRRHLM